jgi:hypothetical protein
MTSEQEKCLAIFKSLHLNLVKLDLCTLYAVHKCAVQFIIVFFLALHGLSVNHVYVCGTSNFLGLLFCHPHFYLHLFLSSVLYLLSCRQWMTLSFAASIHFAGVVKYV